MKIPLSWLREYVELNLPVAELSRRLTLAGLEVSGVRAIGLPAPEGLRIPAEEIGPVWATDKVITARVLRVEKHPNADKLKLVTADYGAAAPKVCVTGAPNISIGDQGPVVVLGLAGTQYWDGHATPKQIRELKPSVLRGVPSDAMVMSEFELGISEEHEGIILLPADTPVGVPAAELMGDIVFEADILPNMARCLALLGVAREVSALTGQPLRLPPAQFSADGPPIDGKVTVAIADSHLCARYAAALIDQVTVGASPLWMQRRLQAAGMRPINAVVDVTNYVMLEWGQPLHAFDYDVLVRRAGGRPPAIAVRPARPGEILVTLDNVERKLTADMLVIADAGGPIALAGIMGGLESEVSKTTRTILLEAANFDWVSIRRTMRALDLPSEASLRFSKGIHPEIVAPAVRRAAQLLHQLAGGIVSRGLVDEYSRKLTPQVIDLPLSEVRRLLGVEIPLAEAQRLLAALDFDVEPIRDTALRVKSPPNRLDIQAGAADLIEEIARLHGYDRLPATLLADALPPQSGCLDLVREETARDRLVALGLQEVITYSLTTPEREAPLLGMAAPAPEVADDAPKLNVANTLSTAAVTEPEHQYLRLVNPISTERTVLRHTVLAGVLDVVAANVRHSESVAVFEIGAIYLPTPQAKLPDEPRRLAIALTGPRISPFWQDPLGGDPAQYDFFDLKGAIESLLSDLHVGPVEFRPTDVGYLHPGRSAELYVDGVSAGPLGELHPRVADRFDLAARRVQVAEIDLDVILASMPDRFAYVPVPRFPAALRDIAVVVAHDIPVERVVAEIRAGGGSLLRAARLFDLYRGPSIPDGTKSLAFALSYQAEDRTLTDKEIDKLHKKIEDRLVHVLKASIRGKDEKKG